VPNLYAGSLIFCKGGHFRLMLIFSALFIFRSMEFSTAPAAILSPNVCLQEFCKLTMDPGVKWSLRPQFPVPSNVRCLHPLFSIYIQIQLFPSKDTTSHCYKHAANSTNFFFKSLCLEKYNNSASFVKNHLRVNASWSEQSEWRIRMPSWQSPFLLIAFF
jgi:hypothetical protein